jgi:putative aldouronate transport system substrate-binding protein
MKQKKVLVSMLAAAMLLMLALAGCSSNNGDNGNSPSSNSTNQAGGNHAGAEDAAEVAFPLDQQVTLKMVGIPHQNVKKDYNEMSLFKQLEEQTKVRIDWELIPSDAAVEKMNLIFATNDLPDAFFGPDTTSAVTQDVTRQLIPLNDLIDQYAPNFKAIMEADPTLAALITKEDGNIYHLPMMEESPPPTLSDGVFINKKWLDELGLAVPTTIDEFYNVLKAFKEKDPNKNGNADEIPISFIPNHHIQGPESLAAMFGKRLPGHNTKKMIVDDGEIVFAPMLEENKDFYVWINKLYKEGLIDKEIFTHDANVYRAKVQNGNVGIFFAWTENWAFGSDIPDYEPLLPLKGPNGDQGWNSRVIQVVEEAFSITKANKHPELTMAWVDQFYGEEMSIGATEGTVGVVLTKEGDQYVRNPIPEGFDAVSFRYDNAPGYYVPRWITEERFRKIQPDDSLKQKLSLVDFYRPYTTEMDFRLPAFNQADQERIEQWRTDVLAKNAFYLQAYAKMVTGDDPEAEWGKMVDGLKKLGVEEVRDIYQTYYDKINE